MSTKQETFILSGFTTCVNLQNEDICYSLRHAFKNQLRRLGNDNYLPCCVNLKCAQNIESGTIPFKRGHHNKLFLEHDHTQSKYLFENYDNPHHCILIHCTHCILTRTLFISLHTFWAYCASIYGLTLFFNTIFHNKLYIFGA